MIVRAGALALLSTILVACGGESGSPSADQPLPPRATAPGDTVELDRWNLDEAIARLEEAGFGVQRTGTPAQVAGLEQSGELLRVGGNELRLFLYPDAAARRSDGARLPGDRIPSDTVGGREGRVIATNNLIAVYYPRTELQLERVTNVLLARYTEDR